MDDIYFQTVNCVQCGGVVDPDTGVCANGHGLEVANPSGEPSEILVSISEFGLRLEELANKQNMLISNLIESLKGSEVMS
jgi:hypothetical protein